MDAAEFENELRNAIEEWIGAEESFDDDPYIRIEKATLKADVIDGEVADEAGDDDGCDYYSVMDFVSPSAEGRWIPDPEAVAGVVAEYFN